MRKSKFTDEQIIAILAEQERGMATADVCRRHGISSANFYKWKSKYGGLARSPVALIQPEWARTGAGRAFRALAMLITTSGVSRLLSRACMATQRMAALIVFGSRRAIAAGKQLLVGHHVLCALSASVQPKKRQALPQRGPEA